MKNKAKTYLLPFVCALFIACAGLFVACGNSNNKNNGGGGIEIPDEPATYTLTFVTDGGTEIAPITAKEGSSVTPPADPEKEGFVFGGWYLTSEHSGGAVTLPTTMPSENKTFYAKFLRKYVLEYDANAPENATASGTTASTECIEGKPAVIAENGYSIVGYLFMGWSTSANGDVNVNADFTLTQNTIVYAVWNKGYRNKTKQDDYLFISGDEAVLLRNGTKSKGTYNSETKIFSVTAGSEIIDGRLFEDQTFSCYGENSFGVHSLYNAYTNEEASTAETLELFDNGIAKLNGKVAGSYTYLSDGNFMFAATNGSSEFVFKVDTLTVENEETLVFYKQGAEEGVYTLYGGTSVLTLDGYGKATVGGTEYAYTPATNGTYSLGASKTVKLYGNENYVEYNEALNNTFTDGTNTLELDGYVNAILNGKNGTFSISVKRGFESELYVRVITETDDITFKVDGSTIAETNAEKGKYEQFSYGSLSIGGAFYEMTLDGEGNAEIVKATHLKTTVAKGTYAKVGGSDNFWEFTPNSSYTSYGSFKFRFFLHSNGRTMFEKYDEPYVGTFAKGADTITLDGYGHNAVYTKSGVSSEFDAYLIENNILTLGSEKFALNSSNKSFNNKGSESSISYYFSSKNKGSESVPEHNDLKMSLDGFGNASIQIYYDDSWGSGEKYWKSNGTGTYTVSETSPNLWQYVKVSGLQNSFGFTLIGNIFVLENASAVKTYSNADGTTLKFDSFALPIYADADGVTHTGIPVSYATSVSNILKDLIKFTDADGNTFAFKLDNSDTDNLTFSIISSEFGKYERGNNSAGVSYSLSLNGEGSASYGTYTGTYEKIQNSADIWKFTEVRAESDTSERENTVFTFKLIGNEYFMEDVVYFENAEYALSNSILKLDSFGFAEYTDSQNSLIKGTYTKSEDGYVTFTAENGDIILFRCFDSQFAIPGAEKGSYTLSGGTSTLELDGEGNAIFADEESINGTYEYFLETDDYAFNSDTISFRFKFASNSKYIVAYKYAYRYVGANDFNVLILGEYGDGSFINQMGIPEEGTYAVISEQIVKLNGKYYRIDFASKTFTTETEDLIIDGTTLVAYQGNNINIVVPNEVTAVLPNVFNVCKDSLVSIELGGITEIPDSMFLGFKKLEKVIGHNITSIGDNVFYNSYNLKNIVLELHGNNVPELGENLFYRSTDSHKILFDTFDLALNSFNATNWAKYANYVCYAEEVPTFYCESDLSIAFKNGQAALSSSNKYLYKVEGNQISFYKYNSTVENKYTVTTVDIMDNRFTFEGKNFVKEGTPPRSYTDADGNELTINMGANLTAVYNGNTVPLNATSTGVSFEFEGYIYTIKYTDLNNETNTFTVTKTFKEVIFDLKGNDGTSAVKIKQTAPDKFELSATATFLVDGSKVTISVNSISNNWGRFYSHVFKTESGYVVYELINAKAYYLTLVDESNFSFTVKNGIILKDTNHSPQGAVSVFTDSNGEIEHVALLFPSTETGSISSGAMYGTKADCEKQENGSYIFTNVWCYNSWTLKYTFTVTIAITDGIPTSVTIIGTQN